MPVGAEMETGMGMGEEMVVVPRIVVPVRGPLYRVDSKQTSASRVPLGRHQVLFFRKDQKDRRGD